MPETVYALADDDLLRRQYCPRVFSRSQMTLCTLSPFIFTANATFFNREHPLPRAAALFVLNSDTTEHAHYVEWCALIRIKRMNYEPAHTGPVSYS